MNDEEKCGGTPEHPGVFEYDRPGGAPGRQSCPGCPDCAPKCGGEDEAERLVWELINKALTHDTVSGPSISVGTMDVDLDVAVSIARTALAAAEKRGEVRAWEDASRLVSNALRPIRNNLSAMVEIPAAFAKVAAARRSP